MLARKKHVVRNVMTVDEARVYLYVRHVEMCLIKNERTLKSSSA